MVRCTLGQHNGNIIVRRKSTAKIPSLTNEETSLVKFLESSIDISAYCSVLTVN